MHIGTQPVGVDHPTYFIAEAGVNHNGDLELAKDLVDVAAEAGADAVKFQTYNTEELATESAPKADYQQETTGEENQLEMLRRYELDRVDHEELVDYCDNRGVTFLSTPFDERSADLLADLGVPTFKIGSGELDNYPLLEHVAGLGKPMIVSTGMGTMDEVLAARDRILAVAPDRELAFLHCTTAYPAPIDSVNLAAMQTMDEALDTPVGYSDHTTKVEIPGLAVAAGACIVEKHFTLDNDLPGPDHGASMEPDELTRAVSLVRTARTARGDRKKAPTTVETDNRDVIRKSVHAANALESGTMIERTDLKVARPANGLPPSELENVVGSRLTSDLTAGDPITSDVLGGDA